MEEKKEQESIDDNMRRIQTKVCIYLYMFQYQRFN